MLNSMIKDESRMLHLVRNQLALDYNCSVKQIEGSGNILSINQLNEGRRIYESDGAFFKMICLKGKALVSCDQRFLPWAEENILNKDSSWLMEYPFLRALDHELSLYGHGIDDLHEGFLPDLRRNNTNYPLQLMWFEEDEILQFRSDSRFQEAFAYNESHPDILGVAVFDGKEIMGMAGASRDGERLWQIGIDVIDKYRGKGMASMLTKAMKDEVLRRGAVPYYGTAPSHIISKNVAIRAGFSPAWSEIFTKPIK